MNKGDLVTSEFNTHHLYIISQLILQKMINVLSRKRLSQDSYQDDQLEGEYSTPNDKEIVNADEMYDFTSSHPKRSKKSKPRKRVNFDPTTKVFHMNDRPKASLLTPAEKSSRWYNAHEMINFRTNALKTVYALQNNEIDTVTYQRNGYDRGLEKVNKERRQERSNALRAVVSAQEMLRNRCTAPEDMMCLIAEVSCEYSERAREEAYQIAQMDYEHAYVNLIDNDGQVATSNKDSRIHVANGIPHLINAA